MATGWFRIAQNGLEWFGLCSFGAISQGLGQKPRKAVPKPGSPTTDVAGLRGFRAESPKPDQGWTGLRGFGAKTAKPELK